MPSPARRSYVDLRYNHSYADKLNAPIDDSKSIVDAPEEDTIPFKQQPR